VELSRRLRSAGWRLLFVPGARVVHHAGAGGDEPPALAALGARLRRVLGAQ
jgi:GT2 family glycosyltransferase